MELLKNSFEKDLKTKLSIKSSGNIEEKILLLKAFKYYDTNDNGKLDKDAFAQSLSKLGFYGYTDSDLDKLFLIYSNNEQYLDYNNFIDILYNNPSLKKKEEENISKNEEKEDKEEPQDEEHDLIEILVMRLRSLLSKRGLENMISIETGFRNIDTQNAQELDFSTFKAACEKFDFQLSEEEIKELFLAFTKEETTKVNYDEFIRILRGELPPNRKELVEQVFKSINEENKEGLTVEEIFGLYNPKGSYELLYQNENEENARKIFENSFRENHVYLNGEEGKDKLVDLDEFIDYYESVSLMIQDDGVFREVILKSWNLFNEKEENQAKEEIKKEEEKTEKESVQEIPKENAENKEENIDNSNNAQTAYEKEKEFRKNLLGEKNIDVFRDTLSAKGIKTIINFLNQLKQYDRKGDKEISFPDLFEIFNNLNLHISEKDAKLLFSDFSENSKMNYAKFLTALVDNSLNERRENIVKEAFNRLDTENCGIVNLSDVKLVFNSKNSPLVKEGDVTEEEFYNNFMETFQTHHNLVRSPKIKKVNYDEFLNYYKYFSLTIQDDYLFEETLISCWKLSKSKQAHAGPKDNIKNIMQAPSEKSVSDDSQIIKNISLEGKAKTAKKFFPKNVEYQIPYGTNSESIDYSNLLHPKGDLNGIKLNKNMDPMSILRRKVFSRGPRSIMSLRRTFMLYDEDKSNQLTFAQFDKFINDYRLDITEEDRKKIFKLFNKNNSESIDYNELIKGLIGTMNLFRSRIVEKAFEKLDKEKKGKISFDTIINSYDPYKHPQVLNGQRNAEEVLGRFIDIFEYHFNLLNQDKTDEEVTKDEFMEFYNYISACFFDDYEFENITTRVWGLSANENFGKIKYTKKN